MTLARHAARRIFGTGGIAALLLVALAVLPIVVVLQAVTALGRLFGRPPRWRAVRVAAFAVLYIAGECLCLLVCAVLWLAAPVAGRRDPRRWQLRHVTVLRALLGALVRSAECIFRFRLRLENPRSHSLDPTRPLVVLGRHAGPGASFVLVNVLLERYGRVPRIVLKRRLRLDPALDVLLSRIGCAFIAPGDSTAAICGLAAELAPGDALVIFPEGSDWTPTRQRLAVRRLRMRGLWARAKRPHVLPPRPAGTLAALRGAPEAQLAVFMHTGYDDLLELGALWRALPLRRELHMVWWDQPRPELADEAECGHWLDALWVDIDAWIAEQAALARLAERPPG
jgi:1-acyl-sn-glycerol-3-phosphate acyltransferase